MKATANCGMNRGPRCRQGGQISGAETIEPKHQRYIKSHNEGFRYFHPWAQTYNLNVEALCVLMFWENPPKSKTPISLNPEH